MPPGQPCPRTPWRRRRITAARDFARARRQGRSWSDRRLVVIATPNDLAVSRFGFVVGRRVGKAVVRNKTKRRLREAIRLAKVPRGWDLVIIARNDSSQADFDGLAGSLYRLVRRAGLRDLEPSHTLLSRPV